MKLVREQLGWSQAALAQKLGTTHDKLASIEYGRTPLRYDLAWKLCRSLGISLRWLESGEGDADNWEDDQLSPPEQTGLKPQALLSAVVSKARAARHQRVIHDEEELFRLLDEMIGGRESEAGLNIDHRLMHEKLLQKLIHSWVSRVPLGKLEALSDLLLQTGETFLRQAGEEPDARVDERHKQIMWERLRRQIGVKRIASSSVADGKNELLEKRVLTDINEYVNTKSVKSPMAELLNRLRKATAPRGKKSELAEFLGVPLVRVSQWLAADREPGGETTLRLLQWVQQEERK